MIHWPDGLDADRFLADFWQRQALFMPAAFNPWICPISPEELAGLACEPDAESRIVAGDEHSGWRLRNGPFEESDFLSAADTGWTLLVQDVEKHLPELRPVLTPFRFLPEWRIDDLMVSYATPGGSVGPHVDAYDVFLLQGLGRRTWRLDPSPGDLGHRSDSTLRVLQDFKPETEVSMGPGDLLYLPPGVAHHGAGEEASITLSIGFRAPSAGELLSAAGELLDRYRPELRYADPGLGRSESRGGLISQAALIRGKRLLDDVWPLEPMIADEALGRLVTGSKPWLRAGQPIEACEAEIIGARLAAGDCLERSASARFAWVRSHNRVLLFADGESWHLQDPAEEIAAHLCDARRFDAGMLPPEGPARDPILELLATLLEQGSVEWKEDL
ncbi:MAG: cupin domain-containing protein [Gammaproteobacteria bacterium]